MTDDELKELVAGLAIAQEKADDEQICQNNAETKSFMHETDAQICRTEAALERAIRLVGNMGKIHVDIAEEFFFRSFLKNPSLGDIQFDSVIRNLNNHIGQLQGEYDIVLVNGNTLAVIEVKAKAHENDLEKMLQKMLKFPKLFSYYADFQTFAGIAILVTYDKLIEKAQELGLYLITQQGDHTAIVQTGRLLHQRGFKH